MRAPGVKFLIFQNDIDTKFDQNWMKNVGVVLVLAYTTICLNMY